MASRKEAHEHFVHTATGSSSFEVLLVIQNIAVCICFRGIVAILLDRFEIIPTAWRNRNWFPHAFDFLILVIPVLSLITVLSDHLVLFFVLASLSIMGLSIVFVVSSSRGLQAERGDGDGEAPHDKVSDIPNLERTVVTHYRGVILLFTAMCILAVDFPVFPRRMAKTEREGYSVMDLGVGAFMFANALVAPLARESRKSSLADVAREVQDTLLLVALGLGRFVSVSLTDYQAPEAEYGKHWNFFCTLAFVKIFARVAAVVVQPRHLPWFGLALAVLYDVALQCGLSKLVLEPVFSYGHSWSLGIFVVDNRSGLSSCVGFLALFLMWTYFAQLFQKNRRSVSELCRLIVELILYGVVAFTATMFLPVPSRRLANLSYILWTTYVALSFLVSLILIRLFLASISRQNISPRKSVSGIPSGVLIEAPSIVSAMNFNSMFNFLVANLLTGAVNFSLVTISCSDFVAMSVVVFYSFCITGIAYCLHVSEKRVPLKLSALPFLKKKSRST